MSWHVLQGTDRRGASSRVRAREERRGMVRESRRGVRCVLLAHEGPREPRQVGAPSWSFYSRLFYRLDFYTERKL